MIQEILSSENERLTREQIRQSWIGRGRPSSATLWRWLDRAVEQRLLLVEGTGHRGNPFRYGLPESDLDGPRA